MSFSSFARIFIGNDKEQREKKNIRNPMTRDLRLEPGARIAVHPPWHEVEVPGGVRTGFKARRVYGGSTKLGWAVRGS